MSSSDSDLRIQKMKELLEKVDARMEVLTNKSHPQYNLTATDRLYKALKDKRVEAIKKLSLPISEFEKDNFRSLLTEIEMRLSLIGPSVSDEMLRLEGGKLKRRRTKRSKKSRRSKKSKKSKKSMRK
jgi:hypothetical protein